MKTKSYFIQFYGMILAAVAALILSACGGGGSGGASGGTGGGTPAAAATLSGTAAAGTPILGQVIAIDATGAKFPATTNSLGAYTINVAGGVPPFILSVTGSAGGQVMTLTSLATAAGQTVNITPLTDLIVSTAAGQPGGAVLVNLCTPTVQAGCLSALKNASNTANLSTAISAITNMIGNAASAVAGIASPNVLNGMFSANGTGMDALLDALLVTPATAQSGVGAMATVTLIAVPGASGVLGTVTMPSTAGGSSVPAISTIPPASIASAVAAATTLSDMRVCMASLSALYPSGMAVAPASSVVGQFFDSTFSWAGSGAPLNVAKWVTLFSTMPTVLAGTNAGLAVPGLTFTVNRFAPFDFTPQSGVTVATTTPAVSPTTAWVNMNIGGTSNGGIRNMKMVKRAAYTGCPGGWKVAGIQHVPMHMNARITRTDGTMSAYGNVVYSRVLPLHIDVKQAVVEAISSVVVNGPGLSVYSGIASPASAVGVATPVTLLTPPVPPAPGVQQSWFGMQGQMANASGVYPAGTFYGNGEAIQSCQDLAGINPASAVTASAGTPCYDETAVAPGAIYTWTAYNSVGQVLYSFPYQIFAVPLSTAFMVANDANLFAQNITTSPTGIAALDTAVAAITAGTPLDGLFTYHYTISTAYGAQVDHCDLYLYDANGLPILQAEQNADGLPTQQTSCPFNTVGVNLGSLAMPATPFGSGTLVVGNVVLGNLATTNTAYAP